MIVTGYSLKDIKRCDIPGHTDEYGIPVTTQDVDGIVHHGYIYVHQDAVLSVGLATLTVRQLYNLLNDPLQQEVQITFKPMRGDAMFDFCIEPQP